MEESDILAGKRPLLYARHVLWNDAPVIGMLEEMGRQGICDVKFETLPDDIDRIAVEVRGNPNGETILSVAEVAFPTLRHLTRGRTEPIWRPGLLGIHQLMALALLDSKIGSRGIALEGYANQPASGSPVENEIFAPLPVLTE